MKTNKSRMAAALLTLLILCGATGAVADTPWNMRAALTREDDQGETIVNEALLQLAQEVGQSVSGDYVRITVNDALFDGKSLMATWEVENQSEAQLVYLMGAVAEDSVPWSAGMLIGGPTEEFVNPGQTRREFMDCEMLGLADGDTMRVGIRYFVLAPTEESTILAYPDNEAEAEARGDEGKVVIVTESQGQPRFLDNGASLFEEMSEQYELLGGECTPVEAMLGTGRFKLLEELEVSFDLKDTARRPASMLPGGEPAEKEYEGYTMRITRADYTVGTMEIILEAVFDGEESADQFGARSIAFAAFDEKGQLLRDGGMSSWGTTGGNEERDDGTWVIEYCILHRELFALPEYVTVCPVTSGMLADRASMASINSVEGITLSTKTQQ